MRSREKRDGEDEDREGAAEEGSVGHESRGVQSLLGTSQWGKSAPESAVHSPRGAE